MKDLKCLTMTVVLVMVLVFSFASSSMAQDSYMGEMVVYDGEFMMPETGVYQEEYLPQGMFVADDSVFGMPLPLEWTDSVDGYEVQVVSFAATDNENEYGEIIGSEGIWQIVE